MKIKKPLIALLIIITLSSFRQDKPAYQLFNKNGKQVRFKKLLREAAKANVIFFGELHNNPIAHWLQVELVYELYNNTNGMISLGAEMFEADNQEVLDAYLAGQIEKKEFEEGVRLWSNYKTDISPLVEFARENQLNLTATNIPRRYASAVYRGGFEALDTLDVETKSFIAPLPVAYDAELPGYKNMLTMMAGHGGAPNENFPKAQAIKDATMAWFISENMEEGKVFIHFNGRYHSDNYEGILWYLERLRPDLNIMTISTVEAESSRRLADEHKGVADFIISVAPRMTKTY